MPLNGNSRGPSHCQNMTYTDDHSRVSTNNQCVSRKGINVALKFKSSHFKIFYNEAKLGHLLWMPVRGPSCDQVAKMVVKICP